NRETRGQDLPRAQTSTRRDPPHHWAISGLEVSPIFLCTRLTSEAVALALSHVEPHLRYGKLATSNTPTRTADAAVVGSVGQWGHTPTKTAAPFPHEVDQLDPVGVRHPQHSGGSQKPGGPRCVGLEEPCQTSPLKHLGKQRPIVARQPAVEGAGSPTFD